jgi:hypothetical protein
VQVAVIVHETARPEQPRFARWAEDHAHWAAALKKRRPIF